MTATIIDGKVLAQSVRNQIKQEIADAKAKLPEFSPHLAIVQVGQREDSSMYVKTKDKAAKECGIAVTTDKLPEDITEAALLQRVKELNDDPKVHGILVQMPLPEHIDEAKVIHAIDFQKDVDGFHALNIGYMTKRSGVPLFKPCTPMGIIELLKSTGVNLEGKHAVVIGRSDIVGTPVASLLTGENATVTLCHSKTVGLENLVKQADIVVAAIGKPELIKGSWIKPGAIVIDVGISGVPDSTKKSGTRWAGDVEFDQAKLVASAITPVPGGVGPMTVAMLMKNTCISAKRWSKLD
ncbi:methylenetetrahydrofolate dehydrogenase/methylenetetrahydrofolate cyclohydrolase [Phycomyces nitens]|nr:methylenetetrahydrofolate dehydrogenase/methylenetetrahydrofolate cyclohydrolase [Phycomyces nitens]